MTEPEAFQAGREAFKRGDSRLSCPFPAPYSPPRTPADAAAAVSAGYTIGAFWLDGFEEEERDAGSIRSP